MEFLEYPSMSSEIRGSMKGGQLKLTDDKIVFTQSKSGKKDVVKVRLETLIKHVVKCICKFNIDIKEKHMIV